MNELNSNVDTSDDYTKYRGKCKEFSEKAVADDPSLTLVRDYYHCPFWGRQEHWWTVRQDGTVYDPTKDQFLSKGIGEYEPFNGYYDCVQCGKSVAEDAYGYGNYAFCSSQCAARFVGVY